MADALHDAPAIWLLTDDLPCLGCQYNLRGLVGPIVACPECGHHNDLTKAYLWNQKKIHIGVRIREHWPTSAVMWSLIAPIATAFASVALSGKLTLIIYALFVMGVWLAIWLNFCIKWVKHCHRKTWGLTLLVMLHVCAWVFLAAPVLTAICVEHSGSLAWLFLLLIPIAAALILIIRRAIHRADREGQFRDDWKKWHVPVGNAEANHPMQKQE